MTSVAQSPAAGAPARRLGRYRWIICALLFFAATINYVDRQVIGLLKPTLQQQFGWSEIDYNPGGGWLNSTRVAPHIFTDYAQTLNMRDATLTTSYRFVYASKSTDVKVTTFVSQAANHLAATQLSITPQFDGSVQLTFPIRLWSEHAPRFPIAKMSGDDMIAAVIASTMPPCARQARIVASTRGISQPNVPGPPRAGSRGWCPDRV